MTCTNTALISLLTLVLGGCLPMTFSHDGEIDFNEYQSVYVQPIELTGTAVFSDIDTATQSYLIDVLKQEAGFGLVTNDPSIATDAVLVVKLRVNEEYENRDGAEYRRYPSYAEFTLRTPSGTTIVESSVSDESDSIVESQQDTLDEVAHFFLAPYRI